MANIIDLSLNIYRDGLYTKQYYQKSVTAPIGIGQESDVLKVICADSLKVHIKNASLYETLSSEADIINDTAYWEQVTDGSVSEFTLSTGACFLKIINNSGTEEALLNATGV